MATVTDWLEGARVRTLPASVSPVIAGAGITLWEGTLYGPILALAFALALLLQIGVNFANDYS
ncbi:1,4-dihydroxy-2-naphthoate polyprenyltransferase, partial [Actinotignum timonense]|nr:1,4-dihydroxy-2-naphthoate polyprenyltransferase [Actinotignum timonense]